MSRRATLAGAALCVFGLPIEPETFVGTPFTFATAATRSTAFTAVPPRTSVIRGVIAPGTSLSATLDAFLAPADVHRLVQSSRAVYDLAAVKPGRPFRLTRADDGSLRTFAYAIDELRTLRVFSRDGAFEPEMATRAYETRLETAQGVIESSLFGAIDTMGEKDELAVELSEIFAWDIDFNTMLQRGDTFRVSVEKMYLDGRLARYGRIIAAEFVNAGKTHTAVRFDSGKGAGYFDPNGDPLKKAFLKSPLRFTRVSSRFSSGRFHPILHRTRAHQGADLAAPHGTPVRAIGNGAVTAAGWQGGYGRTVVVRHANGFASLYGHLSKIAVRSGQRVSQGEILGNVGSTGLATGAHLHFGMTRNGRWTDPLRVQSPPAEPLDPSERAAFRVARDVAMRGLPPQQPNRTRLASTSAPPGTRVTGGTR